MPQSNPSSSPHCVFISMVCMYGNLCHVTCEGHRLVELIPVTFPWVTRLTPVSPFMCVGVDTCGGQRVTWSWLSLAMWIPWVELQLSGLARPFPMELCHQALALHSQRPPSPLKSWWWLKGGRAQRLRVFPSAPSAPSVLPSSYRAE